MQLDDKGAIFIDRNGELFIYILDYLRTGRFIIPESRRDQRLLSNELEFYGFQNLLSYLPERFMGGTLIDVNQQLKLNEFYGTLAQQWKLLYKASRDGFSATTFHALCDNKGPTMTIIKSSEGGWLFGGFTREQWTSSNTWKADNNAFIFTITNPHNIPATKFNLTPGQPYGIGDDRTWGPTFGNGLDIQIMSDSNTNTGSSTNFPGSYTDTTGIPAGTLFTGARNFKTADIEVYAITM